MNNWAIFNHMASCDCRVSTTDFSVLYSAKDEYELSIVDVLLIADNKPELDRNLSNNSASLFLKL